MPILKVAFSDGAKEYNPAARRMLSLLIDSKLGVETDFNDAELLIYSDFGEQHWEFKGRKIYITGENMLPDFDQCDLAFTPHEDLTDPRCVRLPYYAQVLPALGSLVRGSDWQPENFLERPKFCSFIASNPRGRIRNSFFKKLNRIKRVDSAGRHFNNWGEPIKNKLAFIRNYRFNLAFENSQSPGYITEKLIEPLLEGCVPIYWGAPDIAKEFNPDCMINISNFSSFREAIEYILAVDADDGLRLKHLNAQPFHENKEPACLRDEHLLNPIITLINCTAKLQPRKYRVRKLREHTYRYPALKSIMSLCSRIEGLAWKLGWRL